MKNRFIHNRSYGKRRARHRMNVSIPEDVLMLCDDIDNFSAFFTTCLERHIKAREREELRIMDIQSNNKKSSFDHSNKDSSQQRYYNPYKRSKAILSSEDEEYLRRLYEIARYDWVNNDD